MVFKSKVGAIVVVPLFLVLAIVTVIMITQKIIVGVGACSFVIIFVMLILARTDYTITSDNKLIIRCGVVRYHLNIMEIKSVRPTTELTNAPALSIDRLELRHNDGRVLVSPKDKDKFILELKRINPSLIVAISS